MRVGVSGNLRRYVDFDFDIELDARSVRDALFQLSVRYPAIEPVLLDGAGGIRSIHRIVLNGSLLGADELNRPATAHDEVIILTPITGG
ncbi:MAG: MoaD/ThiS family protein [Pseudonocardia sp.]|nr:MoaD/ThiS family protein [Pseudonocardia sp.]